MAKKAASIYLGYQDEIITEKYKNCIDFTTNKVGGQPNWSNSEISIPSCAICGLKRPLFMQIYAPLDNSPFHRTLYVFACVNATCSNQSKGWYCVRIQRLQKFNDRDNYNVPETNINWCTNVNDWDDDDDDDNNNDNFDINDNRSYLEDLENCNEPNGNIIINDRMSDDDEESNSIEIDLITSFANLQADDKNANSEAQGGAVGCYTPNASAEIEGGESELVTIDSPITPQRNLIALLKQTTGINKNIEIITLQSFFITVDEEKSYTYQNSSMLDHVRELILNYEIKDNKLQSSPNSDGNLVRSVNESENEQYEKGIPVHGDIMSHNFISKLQENPGQILRYSRDALPILIAPIKERIPACQNCGNEMICELQILPTIIRQLRLSNGDPTPIEFGNVLIFTCNASCWDTPDKMQIEHVIIQQEP